MLRSAAAIADHQKSYARPCETRERRAKESTMTAIAKTAPVIMYLSDDDRSSMVNPLAID